MILTVTVHSHCAPQTVQTAEGPVKVQPGESITAEFDEAQSAYLRSVTGHFHVHGDYREYQHLGTPEPVDVSSLAIERPIELVKPRRGRPRKVA